MKRLTGWSLGWVLAVAAFVPAAEETSLLSNGAFDLGPWAHFSAPAGWKTYQANHRVLAGGKDENPHLALQKIWPGSTMAAVWQTFRAPAGAARLAVKLRCDVAPGATALVRVRANATGDPGAVLFYDGTAWRANDHAHVYQNPAARNDKDNPYARGDLVNLQREHSARFGPGAWREETFELPVPNGVAEFALDLGVGGTATGDNTNPGVRFDDVRVFALDAEGRVLAPAARGNALDADAVLASPPPNDVRFVPHGDIRVATLDGKPITLLGWSTIVNHGINEEPFRMMVKDSTFPTARFVFTLGETVQSHKLQLGESWRGPDLYDWSYLDAQLDRMARANPDILLILHVALDGTKWWPRLHPDATSLRNPNLPDYLADAWRRAGREAIRQMVAHIQSGPHAARVIGYELFNGASLDCNWVPDVTTPEAHRHFRARLRERYADDAALAAAWGEPDATLDNATPTLDYDFARERHPLIFVPARHRRLADSVDFYDYARNLPMHDFAAAIKEATHGGRLVGFRTGNLLYGWWTKDYQSHGQYAQWGGDRHHSLLDDPNVDYFDQWDPYPGRGLGDYGCYAPENPTRGFLLKGKTVVLQDDVRTHVGTDKGYGATANLKETLAKQKQVFLNAMTQGMQPYLWQMSFTFAIPELMPFWRRMQEVWTRSLTLPRRNAAEIAFVVDGDYQRFIGRDVDTQAPTLGFSILEYPRYTWARGGAGYDMIFKEQVPGSRYKVYVFFHTFKMDDADIAAVHRTMRENGAVAIFVWNDGIIDGGEAFSPDNMAKLAGIRLAEAPRELTWRMRPEPAFLRAGFPEGRALGVLDRQEPSAHKDETARTYPPTWVVADPDATPLGRNLEHPEHVTLAEKRQDGWTSLYSQSPILAPGLLRYAAEKAGAFSWLDGDDCLYVDGDFIGVHTRAATRRVRLRLPEAQALYEVFRDKEHTPAKAFALEVEPLETYWFFRGSRAEWEAGGGR